MSMAAHGKESAMRRGPRFNRWALSGAVAAALSLAAASGGLAASPGRASSIRGPRRRRITASRRPSASRSPRTEEVVVLQVGRGRLYRARRARERLDEPLEQLQGRDDRCLADRDVHRQERQVDVQGQAGRKGVHEGDHEHGRERFKNATTATGTISLTQKITKRCSGKVSFSATLGPAPGALHKLSPASGTSARRAPRR